jgi:structure-specific recognition protein 1
VFCSQARADAFIDDASDSEDHHAARLKAKVLKKSMDEDGYGGSDSEEDEDFNVGDGSDGGEPTDSSGSESGSDADSDEDARPKKKPKGGKAKASPAGKGGKKKKPKAKKDPNEPKRNLSAFMIFSKETRGDVLEKNPGFALGDVGKELGRRWREMDAETKKTFDAKAADAKVAYEAAMKEYKAGKKATVVYDDDDDSDGGSGSD